jgi:hypothetical protein
LKVFLLLEARIIFTLNELIVCCLEKFHEKMSATRVVIAAEAAIRVGKSLDSGSRPLSRAWPE